ncbi:MAG: tetratricopeptide repeat protein, partial [Bacteroidia bacterium]
MKKRRAVRIIVVMMLAGFCGRAQDEFVDSLTRLSKTAVHDTTLAKIYLQLTELLYLSQPDTVIPLCEKAIALCDLRLEKANAAEKQSFLITKSGSLNNIGYINQNMGKIAAALEFYHKGLKIQEEIGDKPGIA